MSDRSHLPPVAKNRDVGGEYVSRDSGLESIDSFKPLFTDDFMKVAKAGASEGAKKANHGATTSKDPYEAVHYPAYVCVCDTEEGSLELRKMFLDWAIEKGKRYESVEEEKFRFKIWCSNKKMFDYSFSRNNPVGDTLSMNMFADMTVSEQNKMKGALIGKVDPYQGGLPLHVINYMCTLGEEELKKGVEEFVEWCKRHKRNYGGCSDEQLKSFYAFMDNKRKIDLHDPGFWRYGYDLDTMDKFPWEASLVPEVALCSRCGM